MGFFQIIASSGALGLALAAMTMAGRNEFGWAYGLFWCSVVVAVVGSFWYGFTSVDPAFIRVGSEMVSALYIGLFLPLAFKWINLQKTKAGTPPGNTSVG